MKAIYTMIIAGALLAANAVSAAPVSSADMQANFKVCTETSPNWTERWGQYIVGFDIYTAQANCAKMYGTQKFRIRVAGCSAEGSWKAAGYYCEDLDRR